ncbi:alpha-beta hydrolase superfamily lysophospholipase [Natronocella acetinitrilica]|uniref:Alpha-beta hydrolase superfamily lysophospholipase n=1 Tax=Natronocella acetinitrilica TaxID=414046 RepID=A0AAE3G7S5_9GAMM|nr:alpha/beta hydrolase [Natronocella acetinitrilica]MCP1676613.1 alpha-beta hydrolase superfamily lysophospholipase [Natronocella acetinitrilica]
MWRRTGLALVVLLMIALALASCGQHGVQEDNGETRQAARLEADAVVTSDGQRLPLSTSAPAEEPPRAVVLALHGFNDYRRAFETMAQEMAESGVQVYAYDQRGFGGTADRGVWVGSDTLIEDARATLVLLREAHPDTPIYLLGKSMGGAVAIGALTRQPAPDIDGAILVAPAVWARRTMPWYQRAALWVGARVAPGREVRGSGLSIRPSDNREMLRNLGRDPMVIKGTRIDAVEGLADLMDEALAGVSRLNGETLILYGEHDQVVPRRPTCRMLASLPEQPADWRFALYEDGYHMLTRDLNGRVVRDDITAWVLDRAQALPSGMEATNSERRQDFCEQRPVPAAVEPG